MKAAVFSTKPYDRTFLDAANTSAGKPHELAFFDAHLDVSTATLAQGATAVCPFVNDTVDAAVLRQLSTLEVRLIALRGAGFNNVDLSAAEQLGIKVARVPAYSPHAVAEHAVALMLALNRKTHRAYTRVREGNFSLDGLLGFDLFDKTVGIIGTGRIGMALAHILRGFGCRLLAHDVVQDEAFVGLGGEYTSLDQVLSRSDVVSVHCPLSHQTKHLIDDDAIAKMKRGVMLINTSRGAVVESRALISALKSGRIGYLGLDVYEEEGDLFFEDLSGQVLQDDVFARLLTFPNVLITGHQAFFTREAMQAIARTTIENLTAFERSGAPLHAVTAERHFCPAREPAREP